jgi:signal transduction histidine kinase/DNA-binding response OmpR family regulator/ligand-binding sensor domain-containing protein
VKKCIYINLYFFLFFTQITYFVFGQVTGIPFIKNYSPKEYGASHQNWSIVQDKNGIMYFGNSNGILEYDGVTWRLIKTQDNAVVRSLAIDESGKIFVGTFGDFGFLKPDSTGTLQYNSLKENIPEEYHDFADIWNIHIIDQKVFFKSYKYLFIWNNNEIKIIKPPLSEFNDSHVFNDTLYIEYWQVGLGKLVNDSIKLVLTKEDFNGNYPGAGILLPYNKNHMLIGNPNQGLFIFDGKNLSKFKNEIDDYLIKNQSYYGIKLDNDKYAFSTINGGVVIMNKDGSLEHIINKAVGLANNTVWQLYVDKNRSLWMALDNGISHVEYPSPITKFDEYSGISGTIIQILRFKNELYLATNNGVLYLRSEKIKDNIPIQFNVIKKIEEQTWALLPFKNELLVGTSSGVYRMHNHQANLIRSDNSVFLLRSKIFLNRIYIGLVDGLASMHYENGKWIDDGRIEGVNEYINNSIVETKEGDLWLGHYQGIIHVNFPDRFSTKPIITKYNKENGLPANKDNYIFTISGKNCFATKKGIFKFDKTKNSFIPDSTFGLEFAGGERNVFIMIQDIEENVWMNSAGEIGVLSGSKNENYIWTNVPFLRLSGFDINSIYPEKNGIVWFGGPDGLYRYNPKIAKSYNLPSPALIRKVSTLNDSLLFGGCAYNRKYGFPEFDYSTNALRFEFALPIYENETTNRFQYYLEGFDKQWSQWTKEPKVNYTNIPEGRYLFRVKAKNIYNTTSKEATYAFEILPPWYRTSWAYIIYSFFTIGIIFGLIKLRSLKLEYEKIQLEKVITERTDEINIKNKKLEEQAKILQEMDEVKSRFFANISHELRTPLTLIKGPTEEILNKTYPGDKEQALKSVLNNTDRMLRLINELLDLSKLESGSMKLNTSLQNLSVFINVVVNSFMSLAESRNIQLQYIKPKKEIELYFDCDKLEIVLINLLSNAFKFTPEGGYITVALHTIRTNSYPQGAAEISVHDSGIGIPENELEKIFDRFIQANNFGNTRLEGSGIGLALAKELVELHWGKITAASSVEEGTEFDVVLPLDKYHLKPEDIIKKEKSKETPQLSIPLNIAELQSDVIIEPQSDNQADSGEKNLVLIIEDNAEVRNYVRVHLKKDYEIIEADNGISGLKSAQEHLPDLIISDVMMPEVDGYMLTEAIKKSELTSHIPIILLTAKASDEAKIEGLESGADAYMAKPFNVKELEVRVKKLIENRNNLREKFKKEFLLEPTDVNAVSLDDDFIKRVHDTIEEKMADPEFNVEVLLKDFTLGHRQFTRKIIALTGETPVQFIRIMRLKKAKTLIKQQAGTVSQIAFDVGFSNLSYFSKCFRMQFGKLPSEIV